MIAEPIAGCAHDGSCRPLWSNDGSFREFLCEAGLLEEDAGTYYPTLIQDSNGNQVVIRYAPARQMAELNTSARVFEVEDVRAGFEVAAGRYWTYRFGYSAETIPHLQSITLLQAGVQKQLLGFGFSTGVALQSPWSPGATDGTSNFLSAVASSQEGTATYLDYFQSNELRRVFFPLGGEIGWDYSDSRWLGDRYLRDVQYRYLKFSPTDTQKTWAFWHHDAGDALRSFHAVTALTDPDGSDKVWYLNAARRATSDQERYA